MELRSSKSLMSAYVSSHTIEIKLDESRLAKYRRPLKLRLFHPQYDGSLVKETSSDIFQIQVDVVPGIYLFWFCDANGKGEYQLPTTSQINFGIFGKFSVLVVGYDYSLKLVQELFNIVDKLRRYVDCVSDIEKFLQTYMTFDINTSFFFVDGFGSLLHCVSLSNRTESLKEILKKKPDTSSLFCSSIADWNEKTAEQLAELNRRGKGKETVEILKEHAQINRRPRRPSTPLPLPPTNVLQQPLDKSKGESLLQLQKEFDEYRQQFECYKKEKEEEIQKLLLKIKGLEKELRSYKEKADNITNASRSGEPTGLISSETFNQLQINAGEFQTFKSEHIKKTNIQLVEELSKNSFNDQFVERQKEEVSSIFQNLILNNQEVLKHEGNVNKEDLLAVRIYSMEEPYKIYLIVNGLIRSSLSENKQDRIEIKKKILCSWKSFIYHLQCGIVNLIGPKVELTVYRGQSFIPDGIDSLSTGDEVIWPAFTSCTTSEKDAMRFTQGGILFKIQLQPNQGAFIKPYSAIPNEEEVLLPAFCKFKITLIEDSIPGVRYYIEMDCLYIDTKPFMNKRKSSVGHFTSAEDVFSIEPKDISRNQKIGEGSFGQVYEGTYKVAIKRLSSITDEFEHELSILSRIRSPHIVHFIGTYTLDDYQYLIMEYLPLNLNYYLVTYNETTSPASVRLRLAQDVLYGLHYLHLNNIIHSDLKDANIMLTESFRAKICDFGASKLRSLTSTGTVAGPSVAGTIRWMAPELLLIDNEKTSKMTDIYSFGVIVWQLYSFQKPFWNCEKDLQIIRMLDKKKETREEILPVPKNMPEGIGEVMNMCMRWDPMQRPMTKELIQLLV